EPSFHWQIRLRDEPQVPASPSLHGAPTQAAALHDVEFEGACDIVYAVAMMGITGAAYRMLKDADLVGQCLEVAATRRRQWRTRRRRARGLVRHQRLRMRWR